MSASTDTASFSSLTVMSRAIFLSFDGGSGSKSYVELTDGSTGTKTTAYLPEHVHDDIELSSAAPNATSYIEIGSQISLLHQLD